MYHKVDVHVTINKLLIVSFAGLLTGCDKKTEIMRYFRGRLRDKNGLLCDKLCKLCDFFLSYFEHILLGFRGRKPLFGAAPKTT